MASADVTLNPGPTPTSSALEGHLTRILLVEDEIFLRKVIHRVLCDAGYDVIAAKDAGEALHTFLSLDGEIDLLITDVVLPGPDGSRLATMLTAQRPALKTMLMSGFPERARRTLRSQQSNAFFYLPKPFSSEVLTRKVQEVLAA